MTIMESRQLKSIRSNPSSQLNKEYFDLYDFTQCSATSTLASNLTKLNIQNNFERFDTNVSRNILEQFQITLATIGDSGVKQGIDNTLSNLELSKRIKENIEDDYLANKKSFQLSNKKREELKEKLQRWDQERKHLAQKLKDSQIEQKHLPLNDKFLKEEKSKYKRLKQKVNLLSNKLPCNECNCNCIENISNAQDLDKRNTEMDRLYRKILLANSQSSY